ncbi:MAG: hypothetical protein ACR2JG_03120 [Geodermatophilaceae bacterium]
MQRPRVACLDANGYLVRRLAGPHPLADNQGRVYEHRLVLYAVLGPGTFPCHWCRKPVDWDERTLHVDHLDDDKTNNNPANLVPSCLVCNVRRAQCGRDRHGLWRSALDTHPGYGSTKQAETEVEAENRLHIEVRR